MASRTSKCTQVSIEVTSNDEGTILIIVCTDKLLQVMDIFWLIVICRRAVDIDDSQLANSWSCKRYINAITYAVAWSGLTYDFFHKIPNPHSRKDSVSLHVVSFPNTGEVRQKWWELMQIIRPRANALGSGWYLQILRVSSSKAHSHLLLGSSKWPQRGNRETKSRCVLIDGV